jgi:transposase
VSDLHAASREELIGIVLRQQEQMRVLLAQVQELQAQVAAQAEEIERLRKSGGGRAVPAWVKPNRPAGERQERKRRDRAFVRPKESQPPDEVREHVVEQCPECGRKLEGGWVHRRRQVIEIVLGQRVIEHVVKRRRCGVCGKRWLPKLEPEQLGVQGKRRFGASVQSFVAMLHGRHRVPMREIGRLLQEGWGLHVSDGEMVVLLDGVAQAGAPELAQLREQVRGSSVVCADETGWRQDGKNGWLWTFATPQGRYFEYRQTRSGKVPEEVLGEDFGGTVVCDCYGGYNRLPAEKQRCWAHLLRDLHELKEKQADYPEVLVWAEAIRGLYEEAQAFSSPNPQRRREMRRQLEARLEALVRPVTQQKHAPHRVLAQRIRGHLLEWFVFVEHPGVPSTNNLAERSLRPAVIARKISGGTRSAKGSLTKTRLMSLFGTWVLRGQSLLPACQRLLLADSP